MTSKIRLGLLTARVSRAGGGVYEAVLHHAKAMLATGEIEPVVFGLEDEFTAEDAWRLQGIKVVTSPIKGPTIFGYAPAMLGALRRERLDLLHLHGIWMYPSMAGERWASASGRPYVISPHGMLDPWILSRGRAKKAVAKAVYENKSWKRARLFHALTEAERLDIAKAAPRADIKVIANSVKSPEGDAQPTAARKAFIYLGRIHPKKNVGGLVKAWSALRGEPGIENFVLKIAGWGDDDHVASLRADIADAADPSIDFVGPLFGEAKEEFLQSARFLVLPSFSEGLPMAIIEAWAASVPTIMSNECNLPIGFATGSAIPSGWSPDEIASALRKAIALDEPAWRKMSSNAKHLADESYSPRAIAEEWLKTYRSLI
ncbi:glycosyltransferase [Mesorhizobium sp. BR1-1-16]|uniref:glycosyltransferase n=1 Tax=Mesorhizobium sp. BR1-1-16 TaxID=2876653 RepID=UPI001CCDBAE6|nr:glycosyltransferase [Mesorhizobium sp. BR1-1-16]MBZ9937888.1 glycosyltransferase [Mesorhizobium sp. BR1-1-16]